MRLGNDAFNEGFFSPPKLRYRDGAPQPTRNGMMVLGGDELPMI